MTGTRWMMPEIITVPLAWAFARGKGKDIRHYDREQKIFSTCAGAAIYRKKFIDRIGDFDEEHFAYLEDLDIGYRAGSAVIRTGMLQKRRFIM